MRLALVPSLDPSDYGFVHRIRTRFAETDAMGVIHHSAYAAYLEEARAMLLRQGGHPYDQVRAAGIDFAVLELFVRYRRPLRFDEVVDIHVRVGHLTRTTFQVAYLLQVAEEPRSTAVTVHGAVDGDGKAVRMPTFWPRWSTTAPPADRVPAGTPPTGPPPIYATGDDGLGPGPWLTSQVWSGSGDGTPDTVVPHRTAHP